MVKGEVKKIPDKMTDSEKKKVKNENKAKANPKLAAEKKEKNDACRERRAASGSTKSFNSLAADAYRIASVTGSQLDDVVCIVSSLSQTTRSTTFDAALSFPADVLDDFKACLSTPPEPSSVVQLQQKEIPMRHLEIMMRRRRRRRNWDHLKSMDDDPSSGITPS